MESFPKHPNHFTTGGRGKTHLTYGNMGASPSNPQAGTFNAPIRPKLPSLETLNFLDLSKLMNDPVRYSSSWPPVPTELPPDIPKFEGKVGDDLGAHVTTFHLWCSSNSLNDDTIHMIFSKEL